MGRIVIILGERSYPITIAFGSFNEPVSFLSLKSGEQVVLVTNETLALLYLGKVRGVPEQAGVNVDSVTLPGGEQYKSLAVLDTVSMASLQKPHGRDTALVALGGDVVGDLTSFVAANYQRGIRFVQVPMTLLSQVDPPVDGETAVDHPLGKNMTGVFYQPASVVVDLDCLETLPPRKLASGLAEAVKYGIIPDGVFFDWPEESLSALLRLGGPAMAYCIRRCCELKTEVVVTDKRKTGLRALLNPGHTFGHVIETGMGCGSWLHGEAVTVSMMMTAQMSERLGRSSSAETQRIITLPTQAGLPVSGPCGMSAQTYLPHILHDEKVLAEEMHLTFPLAIGKNEVRSGVPHELVLNAITDCQSA